MQNPTNPPADAKTPATFEEWKTMTKDVTKNLLTDLRSFAHEHRALGARQVGELRERYGTPAAKVAQGVRAKVETRVDAVAKDLETRYEKLETDIEKGLDRVLKNKKATPAEASDAAPVAETVTASAESGADKPAKKKTAAAKKAE